MLRNPDRFCKAYQAFQNSLSLWAEKKTTFELYRTLSFGLRQIQKYMRKINTWTNNFQLHIGAPKKVIWLIHSFSEVVTSFSAVASGFWCEQKHSECQFLWQWGFRLGHSRWKDTVWFLKDGRGNEWNRLDLLLELPAYTICPVTERKVTTGEKDLALASVPQILSDFCASLVLSWDY